MLADGRIECSDDLDVQLFSRTPGRAGRRREPAASDLTVSWRQREASVLA